MGFLQRWGSGIKGLPDWYLLRVKLWLGVGMCCAFGFAGVMAVLKGFGWVVGIFVFAFLMQVLDVVSTWKQYGVMRSFGLRPLGKVEVSDEIKEAVERVKKNEDLGKF